MTRKDTSSANPLRMGAIEMTVEKYQKKRITATECLESIREQIIDAEKMGAFSENFFIKD